MSKSKKISKEISIVIAVKVILIYILWQICFAHPLQDELTAKRMRQHIYQGTHYVTHTRNR